MKDLSLFMEKKKIPTNAKRFQSIKCGILFVKNGNVLMTIMKSKMNAFLSQRTHTIKDNRKSLCVCQDTLKLKEAVENHMKMRNGLHL